MPTFEIENYRVSSTLRRFGSPVRAQRERVLRLVGPVLYHGIQNKATIAFSDSFNSFNANTVGYLSNGGFDGLSVVGWFPTAEFDYWYDIARAEAPLHVEYAFRESGATDGYLRSLGLNTGIEPIGEGPADSEADLAGALASRLLGVTSFGTIQPPAELIGVPAEEAEAKA